MMHRLVALAIGVVVALAGCSDSSSDAVDVVEAPGSTEDTTAVTEGAASASGPMVVTGANGYTLEIAESGHLSNWWYGSSTVTAKLCGELTSDRTLRIYRPTDAQNQGGVFCEDGGGTILDIETDREFEQPDVDGAIEVTNGDIGTITAGGDTFGKSDIGTVTVEVSGSGGETIPPAIVSIQMSANISQLEFNFLAPEAG